MYLKPNGDDNSFILTTHTLFYFMCIVQTLLQIYCDTLYFYNVIVSY